MPVLTRPTAVALAVLSAIVVGACGGDGDTDEVRVFAAASLTDAFGDLEAAYETATEGVDVQLNLAGSSSLREQILAGAPADVFAAADESVMAEVDDAGAVAGAPEVFARNELRIVVPAGNPAAVTGLADLAEEDLLVGVCAEGVPCGDVARKAFANAGIEPAIDTNEPDVRALLTKVEAGELDAGVVYVTDVIAAGDDVEGIEIPASDNVVASYPIATLAGAAEPEDAADLVAFVGSEEGREILARHGFTLP